MIEFERDRTEIVHIPKGRYLSTSEWAEKTGQSLTSVRKALTRGSIPGVISIKNRNYIPENATIQFGRKRKNV